MYKVVAWSTIVAFVLSFVAFTHGIVTGIGVPYPDPTPAQAAYEDYHLAVGDNLLAVAAVSWILTFLFTLIWLTMKLSRSVGRRE